MPLDHAKFATCSNGHLGSAYLLSHVPSSKPRGQQRDGFEPNLFVFCRMDWTNNVDEDEEYVLLRAW